MTDEFTQNLRVVVEVFRVAVLALLVERALAFLFEWRVSSLLASRKSGLMDVNRKPKMLGDVLSSSLKALATLLVSFAAVWTVQPHLLGALKSPQVMDGSPDALELVLSAFIVAGGSAAAIKLFQDVLGLSKAARDAARDAAQASAAARTAAASADLAEAQAREAKAKADSSDAQARLIVAQAEIQKRRLNAAITKLDAEAAERTS